MKRQRLKIMLHTHQRMKRNIFYLMRKRITGNGLATAVHCAWVFYMIGTSHELSLSLACVNWLFSYACSKWMLKRIKWLIIRLSLITERLIIFFDIFHWRSASVCVCLYMCSISFTLFASSRFQSTFNIYEQNETIQIPNSNSYARM